MRRAVLCAFWVLTSCGGRTSVDLLDSGGDFGGSFGGYYASGGVLGQGGSATTLGGAVSFGGHPTAGGSVGTSGTSFGGALTSGGRVGFGGATAGGSTAGGAISFGGSVGVAGNPSGGAVSFGGATTGGCPALILPNEDLIDDMNDDDRFILPRGNRSGAWSDSHDTTPSAMMFPDPSTGFVMSDTGDVCRQFAVHVVGGQYAIWGSNFGFGLGSPYDAKGFSAFSFWARVDAGTNPRLRVSFPDQFSDPDGGICQPSGAGGPNACYDHWGLRISLTTTWTKITIPLSSSTLSQNGWGLAAPFDPSTLYGVLFEIPANSTFGIWIDDVAFVR